MKKLSFLMIFILTGCGALWSHLIQKEHPIGYSKLITLQSECQSPNLDTLDGCTAAAGMLESSPEQTLSKFSKHWQERVAEGENFKYARALRNRTDGKPKGKYVNYDTFERNLRRDIIAFNRIALPILIKIHETAMMRIRARCFVKLSLWNRIHSIFSVKIMFRYLKTTRRSQNYFKQYQQ